MTIKKGTPFPQGLPSAIRRMSPWCERGFALMDVVVVLVILSILAVLLTPKITDALARIRLSAAVQKLTADIRYARELALSNHDTYGVEFNTAGNYYQIFHLSGGTKTLMSDPHKGVTLTVDYDLLPEFGGVTIGSLGNICTDPNQCSTQEIRIDAFGNPKDRLDAAFTQDVTIVLQDGAYSRTVRVTPGTALTEIV